MMAKTNALERCAANGMFPCSPQAGKRSERMALMAYPGDRDVVID